MYFIFFFSTGIFFLIKCYMFINGIWNWTFSLVPFLITTAKAGGEKSWFPIMLHTFHVCSRERTSACSSAVMSCWFPWILISNVSPPWYLFPKLENQKQIWTSHNVMLCMVSTGILEHKSKSVLSRKAVPGGSFTFSPIQLPLFRTYSKLFIQISTRASVFLYSCLLFLVSGGIP